MKIVLARPSYQCGMPAASIWPIGVGYLSSALKGAGHEVVIIDGALRSLDQKTIVEKCRGASLVGVTAMTHFARESFELCRALKGAGHTVVLGGIHPTISPEPSLKESSADFIITGEAEETFPRLLSTLDRGEAPPSRIIESPRITDLDSLAFPDWEQLNPSDYPTLTNPHPNQANAQAMLLSSRGCCCSSRMCHTYQMWKEQVYFRTPANIMKEVDYLRERFRINSFYFVDENISINRAYLQEISLLMKERGLSWSIGDHVRPETLDEEMASHLKESGCKGLTIGSYTADLSASDPNLRRIDYDSFLKAAHAINRSGLSGTIELVIKMGADQENNIQKTLDFIRRLPPGSALYLTLIPAFEASAREFEEFKKKIQKEIPSQIKTQLSALYSSGDSLPDYEKSKGITLPSWGLKYLLEGKVFFSRPVRLILLAGERPIPGSTRYTVEHLIMKISLGEKEIQVVPEVDEKGRLRALIPITEDLMPIAASVSVTLSLPRHREVTMANLPVNELRIRLPDIQMLPDSA